jgi:hypothetical protein
MVAETFLEKPENKNEVNHKDGNKSNNNVSNLEWVTSSENKIHSFKVLKNQAKTEKAHEARKVKIQSKNLVTGEVKDFNSLQECANYFSLSYQQIQYYIKKNKPYKKEIYFSKTA